MMCPFSKLSTQHGECFKMTEYVERHTHILSYPVKSFLPSHHGNFFLFLLFVWLVYF